MFNWGKGRENLEYRQENEAIMADFMLKNIKLEVL